MLAWAGLAISLPSENLNLDSFDSSIDFGEVNLRVACGERTTDDLAGLTEEMDDRLFDNLLLNLAENGAAAPPCCACVTGVLPRRKRSCSDKLGLLERMEGLLS